MFPWKLWLPTPSGGQFVNACWWFYNCLSTMIHARFWGSQDSGRTTWKKKLANSVNIFIFVSTMHDVEPRQPYVSQIPKWEIAFHDKKSVYLSIIPSTSMNPDSNNLLTIQQLSQSWTTSCHTSALHPAIPLHLSFLYGTLEWNFPWRQHAWPQPVKAGRGQHPLPVLNCLWNWTLECWAHVR